MPMGPAPVGEDWQLMAVDLGVDIRAVDGRVHKVLHSQDLGGDVLGRSILKSVRLYQDERKTQVKSWVDQV